MKGVTHSCSLCSSLQVADQRISSSSQRYVTEEFEVLDVRQFERIRCEDNMFSHHALALPLLVHRRHRMLGELLATYYIHNTISYTCEESRSHGRNLESAAHMLPLIATSSCE